MRVTKKIKKAKWQTHLYLDEDDKRQLEAIADRECRSLSMQIIVYVKRGIEQDNSSDKSKQLKERRSLALAQRFYGQQD